MPQSWTTAPRSVMMAEQSSWTAIRCALEAPGKFLELLEIEESASEALFLKAIMNCERFMVRACEPISLVF